MPTGAGTYCTQCQMLMGEKGTAQSKINAFQQAGLPVAKTLWEIPQLVKKWA